MVVDANALKPPRDRLDFGRHAAERTAVHGDKEVKGTAKTPASALQLAHGNQVGRAFEEAGLPKRVEVGGRPRVLPGASQKPRQGDHRAERIPVGAQVPRNENPLCALNKLLCGVIVFPLRHR